MRVHTFQELAAAFFSSVVAVADFVQAIMFFKEN